MKYRCTLLGVADDEASIYLSAQGFMLSTGGKEVDDGDCHR